MALAFAKIEGASKDKVNPAFRSKYADLGSVIDAIKPALTEYGLWFRQVTHHAENGVCIETIIHHSSGESLSCGELFVPASKHDPQGYGSALTYCRRYSLQTAFGVPSSDAEDDDGNSAVASKPAQKPTQKPAERANEQEAALILDSLREAAVDGLEALQARFKAIPNSPTKTAVWTQHQGELKAVAARVHMPEVPAFPSTKVAA